MCRLIRQILPSSRRSNLCPGMNSYTRYVNIYSYLWCIDEKGTVYVYRRRPKGPALTPLRTSGRQLCKRRDEPCTGSPEIGRDIQTAEYSRGEDIASHISPGGTRLRYRCHCVNETAGSISSTTAVARCTPGRPPPRGKIARVFFNQRTRRLVAVAGYQTHRIRAGVKQWPIIIHHRMMKRRKPPAGAAAARIRRSNPPNLIRQQLPIVLCRKTPRRPPGRVATAARTKSPHNLRPPSPFVTAAMRVTCTDTRVPGRQPLPML